MPRRRPLKIYEDKDGPDMLVVDEVAALMGVSRRQVERLLGTGCIPGSVKIGWFRRVRRSVLVPWIEAGCPGYKKLPYT